VTFEVMGANSTTFLAIIAAFIIYVTMRGELPKYIQVFL